MHGDDHHSTRKILFVPKMLHGHFTDIVAVKTRDRAIKTPCIPEPLIDKVEITEVNPQYAFMHYPDRRQDMVSLRDLTLMEGGGKSETSQELRMPTLDTLTDDYLQPPSPSGMNQAQTSN